MTTTTTVVTPHVRLLEELEVEEDGKGITVDDDDSKVVTRSSFFNAFITQRFDQSNKKIEISGNC
jgi:hypothetical protein